jgi:hypothetical protein
MGKDKSPEPMNQTQLLLPDTDPMRNDIEREYRNEWLPTHPQVMALIERFALEKLSLCRPFGIKAVVERVRWETDMTWEKSEGYKINDKYTAYIARDLIAKYPAMGEFIETRRIRTEDDEDRAPTEEDTL